jgi:hypothetical protein
MQHAKHTDMHRQLLWRGQKGLLQDYLRLHPAPFSLAHCKEPVPLRQRAQAPARCTRPDVVQYLAQGWPFQSPGSAQGANRVSLIWAQKVQAARQDPALAPSTPSCRMEATRPPALADERLCIGGRPAQCALQLALVRPQRILPPPQLLIPAQSTLNGQGTGHNRRGWLRGFAEFCSGATRLGNEGKERASNINVIGSGSAGCWGNRSRFGWCGRPNPAGPNQTEEWEGHPATSAAAEGCEACSHMNHPRAHPACNKPSPRRAMT